MTGVTRQYRRVLVTNSSRDTREVDARTIDANAGAVVTRALGLAWPPQVFSLTHVAIRIGEVIEKV